MNGHAMESVKGVVVLQKKNVLDLNDFHAGIVDNLSELLGSGVSLTLVGLGTPPTKSGAKLQSEPAYLKKWITTRDGVVTGQTTYPVEFKWDSIQMGTPGAFFIKNFHKHEFFLNSLTLHLPGAAQDTVHFVCDSWVYPASRYNTDRIFFSNRNYLPHETPPALVKLRNEELVNLRGDGSGKREEWDRVYDYDLYNDLGNPDKDEEYSRQVLGGSKDFPYPRRGRTGRKPTKTDAASESRVPIQSSLDIFVPRDERFGHLKLSDFLAYALKSVGQVLLPELKSLFDSTPNEFDSFEDLMKLYSDGIKLPSNPLLDAARSLIPLEFIKQLVRSDGEKLLKFPIPKVIASDEFAWRKDEEFAREMLSGVNPVIIQRLESFPPRSELDPEKYGPQMSSITVSHIEKSLDGLTVEQALGEKKLFIVDHHDAFMPYLNRINALDSTKTYATRTILFLREDGTLKPVAIELSLPVSKELGRPYYRNVLTPAEKGVEGALWQLAKAYVAVNDSGYHQLISHWLRTHAVTEPFIIATNRQLSVMHPVHKLLSPHFRDTMNINALSRQILINAGGILEGTVFTGKYAMEMSAVVYKGWRFDEQGLPADLVKRGMAEEVEGTGLRLVVEDYPYAVDGLEIWSAIQSWVVDYLSFYYQNDDGVKGDTELQAWWYEIVNVGHGDHKDATWWYQMQSVKELEKALTTIIWVASALHAAVNFGQYAYAGYMPNRPTMSRKWIPEEGSKEFAQLVEKPDLFLLNTLSNQFQTTLGIALIEILSTHSSDELYLGQRASSHWTHDDSVLEAFERFASSLKESEKKINERNKDQRLKNRSGPVQIPYTLLYPSTSDVSGVGGLTGKGIPNSVSI
uniref:Lipoxygenase n=1 Tax=Taxus chinensis TaxID=29808 RepID=G9L7U0_TAXCH|nr:lipoxygenase 1 [Taxus chinensis]